MVLRVPSAILTLFVACVPAYSPHATPASVTSWAGCYVLAVPPFSSYEGDRRGIPDSIVLEPHLPDTIALELKRVGRRQLDQAEEYELRAAYAHSTARVYDYPMRRYLGLRLTWTPVDTDSVDVVVWANPNELVTLHLGRRRGEIVGQAVWSQHYAPARTVPATAVAIPCPTTVDHWSDR